MTTFEELIKKARKIKLTPEEREQHITREMIMEAARKLKEKKGGQKRWRRL